MGKYCQPEVKTLLIPSNLDLEKILKSNPPGFKVKIDFFYYLIHLMKEIPMRRKDLIGAKFIPLHSVLLQRKRHNYRDYLDYLVKHQIFKENRQYIVGGGKSRSFNLTEPFIESPCIFIEIKDKLLIKKITEDFAIDPLVEEEYQYLTKWFLDEKISMNTEEAIKFSYDQYLIGKNSGQKNALQKHWIRLLKIKQFELGYKWFNIDGTAGRLHTNLTNMDKGLRNFLRYDGQKIVSVDIKNSQPFLSIEILKEKYPNLNYNTSTTPNSNTIMLVDSDVHLYVQKVVNGEFYKFLIEEFEAEYGKNYFGKGVDFSDKKKQVKELVFRIIFSKVKSPIKGIKVFRKLFPSVLRAFNECKAGEHNRLAIRLQRIEANLVLRKACKIIAEEFPNVRIWTIHDSILTTEGNEDLVKNVLKRVLKEAIGFEPQLHEELLYNEIKDLKKAA